MGKLSKAEAQEQARMRKIARDARMVDKIEGVGYIEDVYGTHTSFNVYAYGNKTSVFYKSAYKLETARRYLNEIKEKKEERG